MYLISDGMTPEPLVVRREDTAGRCRELMARHRVRHLALVDDDGRLQGLITDFALVRADDEAQAWRSAVPVQSASPDTSLQEALTTLRLTTQDAMFVVQEGRPVGILTEHDVVRFAPALLEQIVLAVRRPKRPLVSADPEDTWQMAFQMMIDQGIRHVPVIEGQAVRRIVSMRDLIGLGASRGENHTLAALFGDQEVQVLVEGTPVERAARKMTEHKVGCLPILDFAHRPVGIITRSDVVELCLASIEGKSVLSEVWADSIEMEQD